MPGLSRRRRDLLALGAVSVDDICYVDRYPTANTKIQIQEMSRQAGGLAGTMLVAAARMEASVAYLGVLDDDELSRFALQELEQEGIDCSLVERRQGARPFHAFVIVDRSIGERTILYSAVGVTEPKLSSISEELIDESAVLFVDHTVPSTGLRAAQIANARHVPVIADFERPFESGMEELLRIVDHLIVGIDFGRSITGRKDPGEIVRCLSQMRGTARATVVTAGERGCWWVKDGGASHHHPAFDVEAVDTIGCGDVFHGAYGATIAAGNSVELAIHVASAAAAIKAAHRGSRDGIPSRSIVEDFIKNNSIEFLS